MSKLKEACQLLAEEGFIICVEASDRDVIYNFRNDFIAKVGVVVGCTFIHLLLLTLSLTNFFSYWPSLFLPPPLLPPLSPLYPGTLSTRSSQWSLSHTRLGRCVHRKTLSWFRSVPFSHDIPSDTHPLMTHPLMTHPLMTHPLIHTLWYTPSHDTLFLSHTPSHTPFPILTYYITFPQSTPSSSGPYYESLSYHYYPYHFPLLHSTNPPSYPKLQHYLPPSVPSLGPHYESLSYHYRRCIHIDDQRIRAFKYTCSAAEYKINSGAFIHGLHFCASALPLAETIAELDVLQRILAGGYEELAIAKMLEASSSFAHSDKVNPSLINPSLCHGCSIYPSTD